jgi:hypothetical protein
MGRRLLRAAARFEAGQVHEYDLLRRRSRNRNGEVVSGEGRTRLRLEVITTNRAGSLLECTYLDAETNEATPVGRALLDLTRGLRFRYRTSAPGRFRGLTDARALRRGLAPLLGTLSAELPERVREMLQAVVDGPGFEAHCVRDVPLLHGAYGLACPAGGEALRPVTLRSPLGGPPMEATESIRCQPAVDRETWSVERYLDPEVLRQSLLHQLSEAAARIGRPGPGPDDLPEVAMVDRSSFELEQPGGWPLAIRFEREAYLTSKDEVSGQGETIEINRVA